MTRSFSSTATRNAAAMVLVRLSGLMVGMILTPFLLGHMGKELYGVVVIAGSTFDYLSLLRGGIGSALRRYVTRFHHAGDHEQARAYYAAGFWWAAVLRTGILLVGLALASPLSSFVRISPELRDDCVLGIALIIAATVIADASTMLEIPSYATTRTAGLSVARGVVTWLRLGFVALCFYLLGTSLTVYGISAIATALISVPILGVLAQRSGTVGAAIPRPEFGSPEVRREIFAYGGLAILNQAAELLYLTTDNLLIGRFFGTATVATYSVGARWYPLIFGFLVVPISALTPLFTSMDAHGEAERSRQALRRVVSVASVLGVTACLVPCVVSDLFIQAWVGPEHTEAALYMIVLLVPLTLDVAVSPVWMALYARGRIGAIVALTVPIALAKVAFGVILGVGIGMGPLGFAIAGGVAMLARNVAVLGMQALRPDPTIPRVRDAISPLVPAFLGALPGLALLYFARGFVAGGLTRVIVCAGLGALLCLTGSALATFGPRGIRDLANTALSAFRSRGRRTPPTETGPPPID